MLLDKLLPPCKIHMIGIGGVSMSGLAEILKNKGYTVTGSDMNQTNLTNTLIENNIPVYLGHNEENVKGADAVIYTAAIKKDNPEYAFAEKNNIPLIERSVLLGEITRMFNNTIAIAGTHGKTTTTSMLSVSFLENNMDPTISVGGEIPEINSNYKIGSSDYFILEACEYVESFLKFSPKSAIILNIDNDHLDYFKNFDNIKNAFIKFVKLLPKDGILVVNGDDINCLDLKNHSNAKFITYGIENQNANFVAKNITFDNDGFSEFDVYYNNDFFDKIKLSVPGKHNVLNALASIALSHEYSLPKTAIKNGLLSFTGAHRRFEFVGKLNGASIYDDYAHHPTEIKATHNSLSNKKHNKSWVVFQPHTYSRTKNLLSDFAESLKDFDNIIITDIYAARENNEYGVKEEDIIREVKKYGKEAFHISEFNNIKLYLGEYINKDDLIITLGAGYITKLASMLTQ